MSKAVGKGASKKAASKATSKSAANKGAAKSASRNYLSGRFSEAAEENPTRYTSRKAASKIEGRVSKKSASKKASSRRFTGGWVVQSVQNGRKVAYRVPSNQLELYIKYTELHASDLATILQYIDKFTEIAINEYEYLSGRKISSQTKLRIVYASTGKSVTFRFDGGLLPQISLREGNIEIAISKKIGLATFVFTAIITGINSSLDTSTKYYDLQLKKMEYEEKAEAKAERKRKIKEKEEAGKQFIDTVRNNNLLTQVRINNVFLKNNTIKK